MKNNQQLFRCGVMAAGLTLAAAATAQQEPAPPVVADEPAERAAPDATLLLQQGPTPANPFGATTAPGDPFGVNFSSGIPAGIRGGLGLRAGPVTLYPAIGVGLRYDDNLYTSNINKKSSFATIISPAVIAEMRMPGGHTFDLGYIADINKYWSSSADDFTNQRLIGNANVIATSRARIGLRAEHLESVDPRGATDRPFSTEPDRWHANGISGVFNYGLPDARGRFELEAGYQERRYENNRAFTTSADRDTAFAGGSFYWRVRPKTNLVFQVRHTTIDYKDPTSLIDSTEQRYLVGATWEATAKTTGSIRVGLLRKNFDNPTRTDFSGFTAAGDVTWSPLTYSTFNLLVARETNESSGVGDFILTQLYLLRWNHAWNSRFSTTASVGYRKDDFEGRSATRTDDLYTAGIGFNYALRRWLTFGGRYEHTNRSSNIPGFDYDRNIFLLTVGATL